MGEAFITRRGGGGVDTSLVGISITTPPNITFYYSGEVFDPAGMVVTARYADGNDFPIIGYTFPVAPMVEGQTLVTISFTERDVTVTADQSITVITVSATLAENSWDVIGRVSAAGRAATTWKIGDTKTERMNYYDILFEIIGFDHDNLNIADPRYADTSYNKNKKKAGITFCMKEVWSGSNWSMNPTNTNVGGWENSDMRITHTQTLRGYMSSALRGVLRTVSKLTSAGDNSSTILTSADQLFPLSEIEVFGTTARSFAGEGERYAYYIAGNSTIRRRASTAVVWWLRSPSSGDSSSFAAVTTSGSIGVYGAGTGQYHPTAFCV